MFCSLLGALMQRTLVCIHCAQVSPNVPKYDPCSDLQGHPRFKFTLQNESLDFENKLVATM